MRKNLKTVQSLSKFIIILFLFFISGCCHKTYIPSRYVKGVFYSGKMWVRVKLITNSHIRTFSGYADFQAGDKFFYLRFKSPFNTTLGYIRWKVSSFNLIEIFDLYNKKHYLINLPKKSKLKMLPLYLLGLKEKTLNWNFSRTYFKYYFDKNKKEGRIKVKVKSDVFQLKWKIKSISFTRNLIPMFKNTDFSAKLSEIKIIL